MQLGENVVSLDELIHKADHRSDHYWSTPKHKLKHKLEKWFIISGGGVRPYIRKYVRTYVTYVRTKQNNPIKD